MDSIRTVGTSCMTRTPVHLYMSGQLSYVLQGLCTTCARPRPFRPKPRLLRLQAKPAALCLAVHCCLVSQWHRSLSSTLANCTAALRSALLLDLPYGWATSGTSGTLLRSSLVSCGWWQPFWASQSDLCWLLRGPPWLPADLLGGCCVVTALVTFCLWPWLETTWTSWTSCRFAWWLGGDSPGHFLLLQRCLRHCAVAFGTFLHVLGPRALRLKDL